MTSDKPPTPSVWTRPHPKRTRPALNRERIVAEAVRLLDDEGLESLSMRTLAVRLGTAATSLYRHVTSKDELIELVVDELYGELDVPDPAAEWRAPLAGCARSLRAMILRHPWAASVLGQVGLAELGPNLAHQSARQLALFHAAGFPPGEAERAMDGLLAYVIGMGVSEAAYLSLLVRTGQTEHPRELRDGTFDYGLDRYLDGLQARLAAL